jgi:asparagine synthase (glutamine-hydrolysing)
MCGIAGLWEFRNQPIESDLLSMTGTLFRRGPDDWGFFFSPDDSIGLGHRRLSIIDLSTRGRQPMSDSDHSLRITFNGEIYNYREVRQELIEKGHRFASNTDTEVILYAYKQWGVHCVSRLRGMFAFAIWDERRKELLLFRDRLGVKPLYYYYHGGTLLFASELKALMAHSRFSKELNPESVALYFKLGYVPGALCIFANTHKVRPGCYVRISSDGMLKEESYWNIGDSYRETVSDDRTESQVGEELRALMSEAFGYRLVSDVPVGIFLSGGIDSSLVTALLKCEVGEPVRTFTVGFDDVAADESHWARAVANHLGADHTEIRCSESDALKIVPVLSEVYDEPFSDSSAIPTYLLCKFARESVKVALSADGGDEFFGGYSHYRIFNNIWQRLALLPGPVRVVVSRMLGQMGRRSKSTEPLLAAICRRFYSGLEPSDLGDKLVKLSAFALSANFCQAYASAMSVWPEWEIKKLAPGLHSPVDSGIFSDYTDKDPYSYMMIADAEKFLPDDLLVKVDRASMAVGLEVREPLLDHRLVEYAVGLPRRFKFDGQITKYILRQILHKYVPRDLIDRPKQGFSVPLNRWLKTALKPLVLRSLDPGRVKRTNLLSPVHVKNTVDRFMAGDRISAKRIWNLLQFQLWHDRWLSGGAD